MDQDGFFKRPSHYITYIWKVNINRWLSGHLAIVQSDDFRAIANVDTEFHAYITTYIRILIISNVSSHS
jgi:hypothetical protein